MGCLPLSCPHCRHHMQAGQASREGGSRSLVNATLGVNAASLHYTLSHTEEGGPGHAHAIAQKPCAAWVGVILVSELLSGFPPTTLSNLEGGVLGLAENPEGHVVKETI